jgi:hypothetical protein
MLILIKKKALKTLRFQGFCHLRYPFAQEELSNPLIPLGHIGC